MPVEQLTIDVIPDGRRVTLRLSGEIGSRDCPRDVREAAQDAIRTQASTIYLDLTNVTLWTPPAWELVATQRRAKREGGSVRLVGPTGMVLRALQITGVDQNLRHRTGYRRQSPCGGQPLTRARRGRRPNRSVMDATLGRLPTGCGPDESSGGNAAGQKA